MVGLLLGCSEGSIDTTLDNAVKFVFKPKRTPQQYMLVAVSSPDPDERREAVTQIAKSDLCRQEWAIKGLVAITLLENEPQTRCVAIRALARTGDPRAVETMLKILNYREQSAREVWPPTALVRWDATKALAMLAAANQIPEEQRTTVHAALLDRLRQDADWHARLVAAGGLRYFPSDETVEALVVGLEDEQFAVAHECENSLVHLTGCTNHANAYAWQQWLAENRGEMFVHAGEVPESRRPPYDNGWEKTVYETKDMVRWLWPGPKED